MSGFSKAILSTVFKLIFPQILAAETVSGWAEILTGETVKNAGKIAQIPLSVI